MLIFLCLILFSVIMFRALNQLVKDHGDGAEDDDGCNYHVELEETESVKEMDRQRPVIVFRGRVLYNVY